MTEQNPNVAFTVKELFQDIRDQLAKIDAKLDSKAEQREVDALRGRVEVVERQNASWRSIAAFVAGVAGIATAVGLHFL